MKRYGNYETVQIEYDTNLSKEGCIVLNSNEKCLIFQLSPFDSTNEHLLDILNSIEEINPTFKNEKFIFKSSKGFQISISDLNLIYQQENSLAASEKDILFTFQSTNEKLELKNKKHSKKGNLKHNGLLETSEIQNENQFFSEISFDKNLILSFQFKKKEREQFLLDCFKTFEFNNSIKKDSFIYKNETFKFQFEFPTDFTYSEQLWSNDFLLIESKNVETTISTIEVPNKSKNKKSRSKELIEFTKNNLNER